jgi:hypothetical protein
MTSQYGAYALHAGCTYAHAHAHEPEYPAARSHRPVSNTYLLLFHGNNLSQHALSCVICTLSVSLLFGMTTVARQQFLLCIVELHVTVNNTMILNVAQKCFYSKIMSPATTKFT